MEPTMRPDRRWWLWAVTLVAGCASAGGTPSEWRAVTPVTADATFACVQAVVDSMGYVVTASDKAGGFLRGQHRVNAVTHDDILVTAVPNATGTELHVTAESFGVVANGTKAGGPGMTAPSDKVVEDGSFVIARCGPTASPATGR